MELDSWADARAPNNEAVHQAVNSGVFRLTCNYCRSGGHFSEYCPKQAADRRGESVKCMADFERGGKVCLLCQQGDHHEEHHRLAIAD